MSKYVKVDDVMALINTSNRGNCDYFIVDKIEELCNSNNVYDVDKVVAELKKATQYVDLSNPSSKVRCEVKAIHPQKAIDIVKSGGN